MLGQDIKSWKTGCDGCGGSFRKRDGNYFRIRVVPTILFIQEYTVFFFYEKTTTMTKTEEEEEEEDEDEDERDVIRSDKTTKGCNGRC
ncbi:hypothetical protein M0802_002351 [Mischocyttarus mexicanus]|nr:hypothetical protein M0802_002351 [Mischocyttarus mexicanus]